MSRPPVEKPHYFLCESVQLALESMEGRYDDPDKTFGSFVSGGPRGKDQDVMDHVLGLRDGGKIVSIGVAGKIWALMAFWPRVRRPSEKARTPKGVAELFLREPNGVKGQTKVSQLAALLSAMRNPDPTVEKLSVSGTSDLLEVVVRGIAERICETPFRNRAHLDPTTLPDTIRGVLTQVHRTPQDCGRALIMALGLGELLVAPASPSTLPHHIEPELQRYISNPHSETITQDSEIKGAITLINNALGHADGQLTQAPIVILSGPEQAGKKSVVGDLLRGLKLNESGSGYPLQERFEYIPYRLPVLALRLRSRDYPAMACEVLAFLTRLPQAPNDREDIARLAIRFRKELCKGDAMDAVIAKIREAHSVQWAKALIIFLDAHELGRDSLSRVLQHSGLFRVLEALATSNPESRILLTATDLNHFWPKTLNEPVYVPLKLPKLSRLHWYLCSKAEKQFQTSDSARGVSIEKRLARYKNKVMTGDVLLALSVILSIGLSSPDTFCRLIVDLPKLDEKGGSPVPADYGDAIFAKLVEALDSIGVLPAVALIAATRITSDSLTETSLETLLGKFTSPKRKLAVKEVQDKLTTLATAAQTLFISLGPQSRVDREELGHGEDKVPESKAWSMTNVIALAILRQLQLGTEGIRKDWPLIRRNALRLVATAARRRAQIKRIRRAEDASVADRADLARDIQSYIALLASLPPLPYNPPIGSRALRLSLNQIFTIDETFDPLLALQFAVYCMLRQDIDPDHRLSMVTDQDDLRLRLYLLIFCPPGEIQSWRVSDLQESAKLRQTDIFKTVPTYLTEVFGPEMVLELLLSIAMAAFHCQVQPVVDWAWSRAEEIRVNNPTEWNDQKQVLMARLDCTVADMAILTGSLTITKEQSDRGLPGALEWVCNRAQNLVSRLGVDPMTEDRFNQLDLVRARMRLTAREAQLVWMAQNDAAKADKLYFRLEELEHALAPRMRHGEPVVLSGRTARRYARFLCRGYPILRGVDVDASTKAMITDKVRHIIEANVTRLNRYAGADRIGLLLDQAVRHAFGGHLEKAIWYVGQARERLNDSSISRAGRLDFLVVSAACDLRHYECHRTADRLHAAKRDIAEIERTAKEMGLVPFQVIALLLSLRALLVHRDEEELAARGKDWLDEADFLLNEIGFEWARKDLEELRVKLTALL